MTRRKKISSILKTEILKASSMPGAKLSRIAKIYDVSVSTIRTWQKAEKLQLELVNKISEDKVNNFVELKVTEKINEEKKILKEVNLRKASFEFKNLNLTIEGEVKKHCSNLNNKNIGGVMLQLGSNTKIYLRLGYTDMRKGINGLSELAKLTNKAVYESGGLFVFRGKSSDKIKILWWDGQGFCLFYKSLDKGKFTWPQNKNQSNAGITIAELSMLLEGIDWRTPKWSKAPEYIGQS